MFASTRSTFRLVSDWRAWKTTNLNPLTLSLSCLRLCRCRLHPPTRRRRMEPDPLGEEESRRLRSHELGCHVRPVQSSPADNQT